MHDGVDTGSYLLTVKSKFSFSLSVVGFVFTTELGYARLSPPPPSPKNIFAELSKSLA